MTSTIEQVPWKYESPQGPTYYRGTCEPVAVCLHRSQGYYSTARQWATEGHYGACVISWYNRFMGFKRGHLGTLEERLWKRVDKTETCWNWTGARGNSEGYGRINDGGISKWTHRVAWEIEFGKIPDGHFVCHHCDNPSCVRPDHLFLGRAKQNSEDMVAKGRQARGLKAKGVRLTPEVVVALRLANAAGQSSQSIAQELSVGYCTVRDVLTGKTWRHV